MIALEIHICDQRRSYLARFATEDQALDLDQLPEHVRPDDKWMATDARMVEVALHTSLPGGTYDRLLLAMFERVASRLVVLSK